MSLVSTTIANLINGVSQQPFALRLASQCDLQENCNSSVVDGLCMRNGTKHSAKIMSTPLTNAFTHIINRDAEERYHVIIAGSEIKVYDLAGNAKTVNYEAGAAAYLSSAAPADDFTALTVADYTFILNKQQLVVADAGDIVPARPVEALVWIKTATPDSTYKITVDGCTAVRATGDATNVPSSVATDDIANKLASGPAVGTDIGLITAMGVNAPNYSVFQHGSFIRIARIDNGDFGITCSDSYGDQAMNLIKGTTQRFTNLPAQAYGGFKAEVQGEGSAFNTSYWVEFIANATNQFGGVWKETCKPGEIRGLNKLTMPHILVREADGTFTFKAATWNVRTCGDLTTNPMPSFVDRKINDIFFHRNRLGFLSDESVIMSKAGEFFQFFKDSAIQVLDTDPIDIAVSHTKVSILNHAVPFNESLMLTSDQTQFILAKTNDILTIKTASIDQTTEYECSAAVKPVGSGTNIYFVQNRDKHSAVREFGVDYITQTKVAQDITSHVPKYIPGNVFKLSSSNTESMIVALSHDTPNVLYMYQYYYANGQKLQSAWHSWTMAPTDTILNAEFIESDLQLLISRADGVYIEKLTVTPKSTEGTQQFAVHVDREVDETQVTSLTYNATTDRTSFVLPYAPQAGEQFTLMAWEGNTGFKVGRKVRFTLTGSTVNVDTGGNLQHFRFGRVVKARYVFSRFEVREQASAGGGQTVIGEGRVNVRRMSIQYGLSGYFKVQVTPRGRDMYEYVMSGRQIGSSTSLLGEVSLTEGVFKVPVMARNTDVTVELTSEEALPFSILSADWEAMFVVRSRRM